MCRDSNTSEWIYVMKTGACRVLKSLYVTQPNLPGLVQLDYKKPSQSKRMDIIHYNYKLFILMVYTMSKSIIAHKKKLI